MVRQRGMADPEAAQYYSMRVHLVVIKSFRVCGISVNTDGSEDGEIHCIKEGQIAAEAFPIIGEKTASLFEDSSEDDCDPFAESDLKDEDELADNEFTVDDS